MKTACFAVACLLLASSALAQVPFASKPLAGGKCFGIVSLKMRTTGGRCKGWASAKCVTHAKAQSAVYDETFVIVKNKLCDPAVIAQRATTIARALALVGTEAVSKIRCTGNSFGCGLSISRGSAFASAFSRSALRAIAVATNKDASLVGICKADLEALSAVFTSVTSRSLAASCVSGTGTSSSFQRNLVISLTRAITKVFIKATAKICNKPKSGSSCEIDGGVVSTKDNKTVKAGSGGTTNTGGGSGFNFGSTTASNTQLEDCAGNVNHGCCFSPNCKPGWHHVDKNGGRILFKGDTAICACF